MNFQMNEEAFLFSVIAVSAICFTIVISVVAIFGGC